MGAIGAIYGKRPKYLGDPEITFLPWGKCNKYGSTAYYSFG